MLKSLRVPLITPASGRFLIFTLLCVKLLLIVWNCVEFNGKVYDQGHHQDRALFGGLRAGKMAYNPPLYYLPALLVHRPADVPLVERSTKSEGDDDEAIASREAAQSPAGPHEKSHKAKLLRVLRYTNFFWDSLIYIGWIGYAFPRLLRGFRAWFLASLLLLLLPGFQKLGAMVHPDNAFASLTTVGVCAWLWVRERYRAGTLGFRHLLLFAVAAGAVGLTRPFSIVAVAVLTAALLVYLVRLEGWRWSRLLLRGAALLTIVGVLAGSWYVYRWRYTGHITSSTRDRYIEVFEKRRPGFDYKHYFTTFELGELLDTPNRRMGGGSTSIYADNPAANSFFTLLYSEIWGDHWLYFSGNQAREGKLWPKRTMLTAALAMPPIIALLGGGFALELSRRARRALRERAAGSLKDKLAALLTQLEPCLVPLGISLLGVMLYLYWQTGPALLPGKNSTIKFVYVSSLFGPAISLLFQRRLKVITFNLLCFYFLLLFIVAFPVAMFWPS
ncbi:MAG TPA: hypothetical protein VEQ59_23185 [Polyangiaceae bacterium]|nr:hypothetical protein [Polyangiaceae bacterium]